MKYWTIAFPGECGQHVVETWSEDQIMNSSWYRNWVVKMVQANKHALMTEQNAIDDWVDVHWAMQTDEFGRKTFTDCECGCNTPVAQDPKSMLEFLANRFEYAGVDDAVAEIYARDIRYVLENYRD